MRINRVGMMWTGSLVGLAGLMIGGARASSERATAPALMRQVSTLGAAMPAGHPMALSGFDAGASGVAVAAIDPTLDPPDSPLATGSFVNFESPPVKSLALSGDGNRLFAANIPNNSLVIYDTTVSPLGVVDEIPVGLDPVSVAVQPGTGSSIVWVANYISDNVTVVNVASGRVEAVIEVGDEPVNIVFDATGAHAFVVVQGTPSVLDTGAGAPVGIVQEGAVVSIDTTTRQIIRSHYLDMHTPRAAAMVGGRLAIAALHSGNNTTVVGQPVLVQIDDAQTGDPLPGVGTNTLILAGFFSVTAPLFADPLLSPYPDISPVANAPAVARIVPDAGSPGNAWADIVAALSLPGGGPDPLVVAQFKAELETALQGTTVTNATELAQEMIDDAKDTDDHDVVFVDTVALSDPFAATIPSTMISNVGTTLTGMAVNPATDTLFVSNLEALNLTRLEPNLRGHFFDHMISMVTSAGAVSKVDLHASIPNFNDVNAVNTAARAGSLANPVDLVFRSDGSRAYVAALGTGRVGVLDGASAAVLGLVDVGRGTRSLALDEPRNRLYVFNRTDMTIAVVDVSSDTPALLETRPMFDPEPLTVRTGRDFLYSARFSNNFSSSCAMCHVDGTLDDLSWDLGSPTDPAGPVPNITTGADLLNGDLCVPHTAVNHPLKGPMFTLSLQGLANHTPLHWRGDKPDFTFFNGAFDSLLGGSQLSQFEIQSYATFIDTVVYGANPYRNPDNSFKDPGAGTGRNVFVSSCDACHQLTHDGSLSGCPTPAGMVPPGDTAFNLGAFFQVELVTQLRGINKKLEADRFSGFGLIHDGREEREANASPLDTFLQNFFQGIINAGLDDELEAFVTAYPTNVTPVVGFQSLVQSPGDVAALNAVQLMIDQSALTPSRNDVVAKGVVGGSRRGFVLVDAVNGVFQSDQDALLTLGALVAQLSGGDWLQFTAVPPGSGVRLGINQDLDCLSDGLDVFPQKTPDLIPDGVVDGADLAFVLSAWGPAGGLGPADVDDSGSVGGFDLAHVLNSWGTCP